MQYRHEIGHAPANFALTEQWFLLTTAHFALQTNFKLRFSSLSVSTDGLRLPSFMPILHLSLQFIDCCSPSVRMLSTNLLRPHPAKTVLRQGKEYRLHHALGGCSLLQ